VLVVLGVALVGAEIYLNASMLRHAAPRGRRLLGGFARAAERIVEKAPDYVLDHPYFAVQEIKVFGTKMADRADIIEEAGLRRGLSIWRIDPRELERKIERGPWIKKALVRREFPARVVVSVEEWKPAGIVALDKLYYVDAEGVVFKTVGPTDPVDLPFITGLRAAGLPLQDRFTQDKLAQVIALAHEVERANLRLSEIRFVPDGEIILYPASVRVPLTMGWGDWSDKLARLKRFLKEWHGQEADFAGVDLSFAGQAVVRLRHTL
jgi:cell division protein FtsQ